MKRTLLTVISILLVAASVFGIVASGSGLDDVSDILRYKRNQKADLVDFVDMLEERVAELREVEADRTDDEKEYAESVVTDTVGGQKLSDGQQQYNAGAGKIAKGQAEYDAAEKLYNEKKAEYDAAERQLHDAENQLADAKAQRDAGQARIDAATDDYERAKKVLNLIDNSPTLTIIEKVLENYGFTSIEEARAAVKEYEDGQAQLAEANAQIAAAEQQIEAGKVQLADAKAQLDAGKAQLDDAKAQLDNGKAQLASAKNQLNAGQQQLNDNVEKMNDLKDTLAQQDDVKSAVTSGVAVLMENDEIAKLVTDESDYESVIAAARQYAEDDAERLTDELDVRNSLYNALRILSVVALAAGAIGLFAAFRPSKVKLTAALIVSGIAAVAGIALNIYGLANGYREFVYSLADGAGNGQRQFLAMLAVMLLAVIAAVMSLVCVKAYDRGLSGKAVNTETEYEDEPVAAYDDDDDDDEDYEPVKKPAEKKRGGTKQKGKKQQLAPKPEPEPTADISAIEDETLRLNEETLRLNEETLRLEEEAARQAEYDKARREYEQARKRFEAARRQSEDK